MKKTVVLVLLVLLALTPVFAGGKSEEAAATTEGKKYVIGISQPTFNHPIRQAHFWAAEIWNETHPNVEFLFMDGRKEAAKQIADVEDLTARQVDLIMIAEHAAGSTNEALKRAVKAGIPVIAFDRTLTDDSIPVSTITGEDFEYGRLCGEFIAKTLNGKGNIVVIQAPEGVIVGEKRRDGFYSVIDKNPGLKVLTQQVGNWQRSVALTVMENILQGFPDIDAVYCDNDEMALGALQAIKAAGREDEIILASVDGQKSALESIMEGGLDFTAKKLLEFPLALDIALDVLEGREVEKLIVLEALGISAENVKELYDPFAIF
jgi:ribose transport system substrate-binding protein